MSNQLLQLIAPVLNFVLIAILGYLGKEVVKVVPIVINFIVAKIGLTNYQKTKAIAWDIWNIVNEHFRVNGIVEDTIQGKITMFQSLIKQKIPGITDLEIETFRQAIAGEFNKDKPIIVQAIEQPIERPIQEIKVEPTIKYVAPDGTELQPITQ